MQRTVPSSHPIFYDCLPSLECGRKQALLFALGVITLIGGVIGALSGLGYLPYLAAYIGAGVSAVSLVSMIVLGFCMKSSPPPFVHRNRGILEPLPNDTEPLGSGNESTGGLDNPLESQSSPQIIQRVSKLAFTPKNEAAYRRLIEMFKKGEVEKAWELYIETSHEEVSGKKLDKGKRVLSQWRYLPPENLLNAKIDRWLSEGIIKAGNAKCKVEDIYSHMQVCTEFIRDCAIAYPAFRKRCFQEDRLWSCFRGYQDYIADIAAAHPDFGLQVILSSKGENIFYDLCRIEIFRSSCDKLLSFIKNKKLSYEEVNFLGRFLFGYQLVVNKDDFEKIQQLNHYYREQRASYQVQTEEYIYYSHCVDTLDLVEEKLSAQGIYDSASKMTYSSPS